MKCGEFCYDGSVNYYYFLDDKTISIYNPNTKKVVRKIKVLYKSTNQDIGGYNGIIIYIRWDEDAKGSNTTAKGARNAIDLYRASDGSYLGTYVITTSDIDEIESIDYTGSGNDFAVYFNTEGTGHNKIYKVTIPFNF